MRVKTLLRDNRHVFVTITGSLNNMAGGQTMTELQQIEIALFPEGCEE